MGFRRLSRNAIAAMLQVVASAVLLVELYRFLIRQLGPEQLGVWSLVVASTAVARLGEFGLGGGVAKFVAGDLGSGEGEKAAATVGMSVVTISALIGTASLILWPLLNAGLSKLIPDARLLEAARALLPWSLGALWLGSMGNVFLNALDAFQRSDLKTAVTVAATAGQLGAAYLIVPRHGLRGLGPVQLAQSALVVISAAILVAFMLRHEASSWFRWDRARFVSILRYGGGIQLAALGQLLFEPTVKALLSVFGGLSMTGYYEMANRAVTQFRAVIVAAYQMLVPYMAHRAGKHGLSPAQIAGTYRAAQRLLVVLATTYFAIVAAALPLILTLWRGRFNADFVRIGLLCVAGWLVNTLAVTAYMLYLATGQLRWTVWTHIVIGLLNVVLAGLGGWLFGGLGVVGGAMLALALGSMVVVAAFHREFEVSWREFLPGDAAPLALISLGVAFGLAATQLHSGPLSRFGPGLPAALAAFAMGCSVAVWRHPAVKGALVRLREPERPE